MSKNKKGMNPVREKQRFSIRKLSVGAASVLLGFTFVTTQATTVHAADNGEQVQTSKTGDAGKAASNDSQLSPKDQSGKTTSITDSNAAQTDKSASKEEKGASTNSAKTEDTKSEKQTDNTAAQGQQGVESNKKLAKTAGEPSTDSTTSQERDLSKPKAKILKAGAQTKPAVKTSYNLDDFELDTNSNSDTVIIAYDGIVKQNDEGNVVVPTTQDFIDAQKALPGHKVFIAPTAIHQVFQSPTDTKTFEFSKSGQGYSNKLYLMGENERNNDYTGLHREIMGQHTYDSILNYVHADKADLSGLDVSHLPTLNKLLNYTNDVATLDVSNLDVTHVTSISGMFSSGNAPSPQYRGLQHVIGLHKWDTSKIRDMSKLFDDDTNLKDADVEKWDTSDAIDMSDMFAGCTSLSGLLNLSRWNTVNVKNMSAMFRITAVDSNNFSVNLSSFNTRNVTDFTNMFAFSHIRTLDLRNFDFSNAERVNGMLNGNNGTPMLVLYDKDDLKASDTGLQNRPLFYVVDESGNPDAYTSALPANFSSQNHFFKKTTYASDFINNQVLLAIKNNLNKQLKGKHVAEPWNDGTAVIDPDDPDNTQKISGEYVMADGTHTGIQMVYRPNIVDNGQVVNPVANTKTTKTRTINIHKPDGSVQKVEQTIVFQQFATYDGYTNVKIGDPVWKVFTGSDETKPEDWSALTDTNHQWAAYDTPVFDNYTASQKTVLAQNVSQNDKDVTVDITYSPVIDNDTETRVLTRTITVVTPDGKQNVITQTITAQRDVTTNKATGQTVRGRWHSDNPVFAAFAAPSVPVYVPSQASVEEHSVSASDVDNWTDPQIKITYSAITLPVDPDNNNGNKPNNKPDDNKGDKPDDSKDNKPAQPVKPSDPAKPVKPTTPAKPNNNKNNGRASLYLAAAHAQHGTASAKAIASAKAANAAATYQAKLPQTGSTSTVAVLALLATGLAAVIGLAGSRKHN